jgi:ABC-2 type transport system permease protein
MEMLLAQPISRRQLFLAHSVVTIAGLLLLCLLVFAGITMGIETNSTPITDSAGIRIPVLNWSVNNPFEQSVKRMAPLSELVSPSLYIVPTMNLFSLGFMVLGLSVMISAFDSFRWRTIGLTISLYILQLLLFILSKSTPRLGSLKPFSFLAAYQPDWIVQTVHRTPSSAWCWFLKNDSSTSTTSAALATWSSTLGPLSYVTMLICLGSICYAIGYMRFQFRDLPAPQ